MARPVAPGPRAGTRSKAPPPQLANRHMAEMPWRVPHGQEDQSLGPLVRLAARGSLPAKAAPTPIAAARLGPLAASQGPGGQPPVAPPWQLEGASPSAGQPPMAGPHCREGAGRRRNEDGAREPPGATELREPSSVCGNIWRARAACPVAVWRVAADAAACGIASGAIFPSLGLGLADAVGLGAYPAVRPHRGVATDEVRQPALLRRGLGYVPETVLHGNVVQRVRAGVLDELMRAQLLRGMCRPPVASMLRATDGGGGDVGGPECPQCADPPPGELEGTATWVRRARLPPRSHQAPREYEGRRGRSCSPTWASSARFVPGESVASATSRTTERRRKGHPHPEIRTTAQPRLCCRCESPIGEVEGGDVLDSAAGIVFRCAHCDHPAHVHGSGRIRCRRMRCRRSGLL